MRAHFLRSELAMIFPTTRWSILVDAYLEAGEHSQRALDDFIRRYRLPIIRHIQSRGWSVEESEDLSQEFFLHVMKTDALGRADAARGRFRSFVRGALDRFLARARRDAHALKRGGGQAPLSLDAEGLPEVAAPADESSDRFDRDWATSLLELAVTRLGEVYAADNRLKEFHVLRNYLPGGTEPPSYADCAARLELSLAG